MISIHSSNINPSYLWYAGYRLLLVTKSLVLRPPHLWLCYGASSHKEKEETLVLDERQDNRDMPIYSHYICIMSLEVGAVR
jgi:hypothetical protein